MLPGSVMLWSVLWISSPSGCNYCTTAAVATTTDVDSSYLFCVACSHNRLITVTDVHFYSPLFLFFFTTLINPSLRWDKLNLEKIITYLLNGNVKINKRAILLSATLTTIFEPMSHPIIKDNVYIKNPNALQNAKVFQFSLYPNIPPRLSDIY